MGDLAKYDAPPGTVWVCAACRKTSKNRVDGAPGTGWDESCFLHAVLCNEEKGPEGSWVAAAQEASDG